MSHTEELARFRPVRAVELAFLRGRRTEGGKVQKLQWMPNSASEPEYRARMTERLAGLVDRLRTLYKMETYRPNTAADCHWCEFKTLCPLWPEGAPVFPVPTAVPEEAEAP